MDFEKLKIKLKKFLFKGPLYLLFWYLSNLAYDPVHDFFYQKFQDHVFSFYQVIIFFLDISIPLYSIVLAFIFVGLVYRIFDWAKLKRSGLKIVEAKYGKNGNYIDITKELNTRIEGDKLKEVIANYIAGDPIKGVNKEAIVKYQYKGKIGEVIVPEYQILELPPEIKI